MGCTSLSIPQKHVSHSANPDWVLIATITLGRATQPLNSLHCYIVGIQKPILISGHISQVS